jgi:BON domain
MGAYHRPLGLWLLALWASLAAADPPTRPDLRDVQVTLYARRALLQDEQLAPCNLNVRVEMGVATVHGPVPSRELVDRVRTVLEKVPGVYGFRSELYVLALPEPTESLRGLVERMAAGELMPPPPSVFSQPDSLNEGVGLSAALANRPPREVQTARPALEEAAHGPTVSLLAPIDRLPPKPEALPATGVSLGVPRLDQPASSPRVEEHPAPPLASAVEEVCRASPRYRLLRANVDQGVVILTGQVARRDHLMELAGVLSRLPGVHHVDLRSVQVVP